MRSSAHRLRPRAAALVAPTLAALTFALVVGPGCRGDDGAASPEVLAEGIGRYREAVAAVDAGPPPDPVSAAPRRFLRVTVVAGHGVVEMDTMGGDSDVYVTLGYTGDERRTAVDEDTEEPRWHDTFVFPYAEGEPLAVSLWDDDPIPQPDQLLGTVTIFPEAEPGFGERTLAFKGGDNGTVTILLELVP